MRSQPSNGTRSKSLVLVKTCRARDGEFDRHATSSLCFAVAAAMTLSRACSRRGRRTRADGKMSVKVISSREEFSADPAFDTKVFEWVLRPLVPLDIFRIAEAITASGTLFRGLLLFVVRVCVMSRALFSNPEALGSDSRGTYLKLAGVLKTLVHEGTSQAKG
jgi:hypothetical protein